jgi:hypothetical protein
MRILLKGFLILFVIAAATLTTLHFALNRAPAAATSRVAEKADPGHFDAGGHTPQEARVVRKQLRAGYRVASDADATPSDERADLENLYAAYHPSFVRGDLDSDGKLDFVQAFVEQRNGALWFDVAVFFGRDGGNFAEPVFVEKGITLAPGDLSIERSILVLTPDLGLDAARRWRYEPEERKFVDADRTPAVSSDQADPEAPDATPDDRPRAKV